MFANATRWKMNTVRIYAHTTDPEHPFMVCCFPARFPVSLAIDSSPVLHFYSCPYRCRDEEAHACGCNFKLHPAYVGLMLNV